MINHLFKAALIALPLLITSCSPDGRGKDKEGKISVIAASFPEYDWVRQIAGEQSDRFDLQLLIDNGSDLHSFTPTVADIADIAQADLLIHNGGVSDSWVSDVQRQAGNKDLRRISLMQTLKEKGATFASSSCNHDHGHGHTCGSGCTHEHHDHGHEHGHTCSSGCTHNHEHGESCNHGAGATPASGLVEGDEHIWLSLRHAIIACERIEDELSALDPSNADEYEANKQRYIAQLKALDEQYKALIAAAPRDSIIICDRFPFRYLLRDYGIKHLAAFDGCSAESEASFQTIAMLSDQLKQRQYPAIFIIQGGLKSLADTVVKNSGRPQTGILHLNAMQAVKKPQESSYMGMMKQNLQTLHQGLSQS